MSEGPTAAMLVIGDEILSGRTQDVNAHHLAGVLTEIGIRLVEVRFVPDEADRIVAALNALRAAVDHVFTSGGIGPTHDDITADAVAAAFGVGIDVREDAKAILLAYYGDEGINPARLRMARIPDGASLIDNPVSRAPGFTLGNVHVMAGVPIIFQEMLAGLRGRLKGGAPVLAHSFRAQIPEGDLAEGLRAAAAAHPAVSIGVYPFFRGGLGCTVIARSGDRALLGAAADDLRALLETMKPGAVQETPPA
ncbi:MAG: molybdopterin-binding protein [Pseudomonadota bacterium]